MTLRIISIASGFLIGACGFAAAQERGAPETIVGGASGVMIDGAPAARQGDATSGEGGAIVEGSPNVFINGRPAAVQGGRTGCGGVVVGGGGGVFINGKPAARVGDAATGCPK